MKRAIAFLAAALLAGVPAVVSAQCLNCGGSAPVYSTPISTGSYAPATYGMSYAQPVVYSTPVQSSACGTCTSGVVYSAPVQSSGCGTCNSGVVYSAPVQPCCNTGRRIFTSRVRSSGCCPCGGMTYTSARVMNNGCCNNPCGNACCGTTAAVNYAPVMNNCGCGGVVYGSTMMPLQDSAVVQGASVEPQAEQPVSPSDTVSPPVPPVEDK